MRTGCLSRLLRSGAIASLAALAALAAGCRRSAEIVDREVIVNSPRSCPVSQDQAYSYFYGSGDFEPDPSRPATASLFLRDLGTGLDALPSSTRALIVDLSEPGRAVNWRGLANVPSAGAVNVLAWPDGESCRLTRNVERRTDATLAVFGSRMIVAGGRLIDGAQVPHTFVGDLATGSLERLEFGLTVRRANPTVTSFAASDGAEKIGALVAGGSDPDSKLPLDSAEVYVPGDDGTLGDIDRQRIELAEPRAQHGAVVLATGETLLVGGLGPGGPIRTMEIVDPVTRRTRTTDVASLAVPRVAPTVLRLASGEILVCGGVDAQGTEVPTLEWFSADATRPTKRPVDLVTGRERAFVALSAGGALAVIAPADPTVTDFKTVWVISADGTLEPGISLDPATLTNLHVYAGFEPGPLLFAGNRWWRWQPWFGAFQAVGSAPSSGPLLPAAANGDPGLALWLDDQNEAGMYVSGFRFGVRSAYEVIPKPLLVADTTELTPDRLAGSDTSSIRFDANRGLLLGAGASTFLSDVTFADFELDVDVTAAAPAIVIREVAGRELVVGGDGCPYAAAATKTLHVARAGDNVSFALDGGASQPCLETLAGGARIAIGLRGTQGETLSGARNLRINRK